MKPSDRLLLTRLAVGLLLIWFVGDVALGALVAKLQQEAARQSADIARSKENHRSAGNFSTFDSRSASPPHGLMDLRDNIVLPVRIAGAVGLVFLACGPAATWLRGFQQLCMRNRRALVATCLLATSVGLFVLGQVIAHFNSSLVMEEREFSSVERRQDRQQRTVVLPEGHPNARNGRAIVVGNERSEQVSAMQTDESVRGHIDLIRVLAGVVGVLGLIYAGLAQSVGHIGSRP